MSFDRESVDQSVGTRQVSNGESIGRSLDATSRRDRRRSESGDTLIEILIALVVLGMASVALIIAFGTSISASAEHRQLSASGIVLDSISQQVISDIQNWDGPSGTDPGALFQCGYVYQNYVTATAATFASSNPGLPSNFSAGFATTDPIEYWDPTTNAFSSGDPAQVNSCEAGEPQLVAITIVDASDNQTFTNSFVVDSPLDTVTGSGPSGTYGAASQLVFTTSPGGASTGGVFTTQPVVTVEDQNGNAVQDDLSPVLLNLYLDTSDDPVTNGAVLSGCAGSESLGVVTFSGCTISVPGSYYIVATDDGLTSQPVAITVSPTTDYLSFTTQGEPAGGQSGLPLTTQPVVEVYKANGSLDTGWSGTITLTTNGGSLTNCAPMTISGDKATFTGCDFAGAVFYNPFNGQTEKTPYTMTATATSATTTSPATSTAFTVTSAGTPSQMVFSQQPTGSAGLASGGLPNTFTTQPVVTLEDSFGNLETSSTLAITLSISSGTLEGCTAPVTASNGSASFSGCGGSQYGTGLTLTASAGTGVSSATSAVFNITGVATQMIFTTQPTAGVSGASFQDPQPVLKIEDATGSVVTASNTAISLSSVITNTAPYTPGGVLSLCTNLIPIEGVVSIDTCTFAGVVGDPYYLLATQGSTLTAVSVAFTPSAAGTPTQLAFLTQPVGGPAGSPLTTQPVIAVEDSGGNIVNTSTVSISLAASGGTLSSCSQLQSTSGLVNVQGCTFGGLDTGSYTLTASASGLNSATSTNFAPSGPGPVSSTLSTMVANPTIVQDNGTATSAVTVTLEDAYGNVIPGDTVMLAQGATSSLISPASIASGSNGTAVFGVTDTNQEIATYTGDDVTQSTVLAQQVQVSFATQLTPPTNVMLAYGTSAGSIGVTFTAPTNAPGSQTYTAEACQNSGMTTGCIGPEAITSGGQITLLNHTQGSAGTVYYVTVTASASSGYLVSTSTVAGPQADTSQVNAPTGVHVTPSTSTAGALVVTFTNSSGAVPTSYSAYACTSANMTSGCIVPETIVSGGSITGLTPGSTYYVGIVANPPAGYVSAESTILGPYAPTAQLNAPTAPTLSYGTTFKSITISSFSAPTNAPVGQTYTAEACTGAGETGTCVGPIAITTAGGQFTGLTATQGSAGTSYYVTIAASASSGYLASSVQAGPQAATSQVDAPTGVGVTPSTTAAGALTVTFTNSLGSGVGSYTATACTGNGTGCGTAQAIVSGGSITGLTAGTSYYVDVTAVPSSSAYVSASSAYVGPTAATATLSAPTNVVISPSTTTAGAITVTFTPPTGGSTYTAKYCTPTISGTCNTQAITSGGQLTGLTPGSTYVVEVMANATTGYLASGYSTASGSAVATTQLAAPTAPTLSYGTTFKSITISSFSAPTNAPVGQTYTAEACTGAGETGTCVGPIAITTAGGQFTGLTATQGSAGTSYYVTIAASASSGYLASSVQAGPQAATSQVDAPTGVGVTPSTTAAGALTVTFTNSLGSGVGSYTATACTGNGTGCGTAQAIVSGGSITGLTAGTSYYVDVTAVPSSSAYVSASSAYVGPTAATATLSAPTNVVISPSTTTAGAITVTFTPPTGGSTYTAKYCTPTISGTCNTQAITSGGQLTGLTPGSTYVVEVMANATTGYLASGYSTASGSAVATTQLAAPTAPTLSYGTTFKSITISSFSAPTNAPVGQTYTAEACTGAGETGTCVGPIAITTAGGQFTGLTATQGSAGTSYYVTIAASASSGYLASSVQAGPQAATSEFSAPTNVSVSSSSASSSSGAVVVTFSNATGTVTPTSYSGEICTTSSVSSCESATSQTVVAGGTNFTGLTAGTSYYAEVTPNPIAGFVAPPAVVGGPGLATIQLSAPVITSLSYGPTAGSITVIFSAPSNAAMSQGYTAVACTGSGTGCGTAQAITSGGLLTSLTFTPGAAGNSYYVQVTATASSGYLAATSTPSGPQAATSQVKAPTAIAVTSGTSTTSGSLTVNFTAPTGLGLSGTYTAAACTGSGTGCGTAVAITSGGQITGLTAGTSYYVQVTAVASTGYVANSANSASATVATEQLNPPTAIAVTAGTSTTSGSLTVNFTTPNNAPGTQTYTAAACSGIGTGCGTAVAITSGGQITGLTIGTSYYVQVTAVASTGYLAMSANSASATVATEQLNPPTAVTVVPSSTTAGSMSVTYAASSPTAPSSYTLKYCTGAGMTGTCVTVTTYSSGTAITGLTAGATYYATVTAVGSGGYISATSGVASGMATLQLANPTYTGSTTYTGSPSGAVP